MNALTVNATEFSRSLSEFLNQVQYKGQVLDIERGKRVVARLSPVSALSGIDGFPLAQLDELMVKGPQLTASDRKLMARDVQAVRGHLAARPDPWPPDRHRCLGAGRGIVGGAQSGQLGALRRCLHEQHHGS